MTEYIYPKEKLKAQSSALFLFHSLYEFVLAVQLNKYLL